MSSERIRVWRLTEEQVREEPFWWRLPWKVGPTPEDSRETQWKTWGEAMRYATDVEYRLAEIAESAKFEMGQ